MGSNVRYTVKKIGFIRLLPIGSLVILSAFLTLKYADLAVEGVKRGIDLCLGTIIPSLFVFMVIAEFLSQTDLAEIMFFPLRFLSWLFRVPGETVSVFALSILGGYPTGAQMIANLVKSKKISPKLGEILLCSSVNCSPSFLIGAVGIALFNNIKIGMIMYLCQVLSAIIVGIIAGIFGREKGEDYTWHHEFSKDEEISYSQIFVNSVLSASKALFSICCFVLLFSVIFVFIKELTMLNFISGLLEVSVGCASLYGINFRWALILSSIYTSFGGVCILIQIKCFLQKSNVKMKKFILFRLLHVALSSGFAFFAIRNLDITEVFATTDKVTITSGSPSYVTSAFLILLCVMLLISKKSYDIMN